GADVVARIVGVDRQRIDGRLHRAVGQVGRVQGELGFKRVEASRVVRDRVVRHRPLQRGVRRVHDIDAGRSLQLDGRGRGGIGGGGLVGGGRAAGGQQSGGRNSQDGGFDLHRKDLVVGWGLDTRPRNGSSVRRRAARTATV